jgi:hypothetical protein
VLDSPGSMGGPADHRSSGPPAVRSWRLATYRGATASLMVFIGIAFRAGANAAARPETAPQRLAPALH